METVDVHELWTIFLGYMFTTPTVKEGENVDS